MTLAMLLFLFQTNKWLFLLLFVFVGLGLWGLNALVKKLLSNNYGN